MNVRNAEAISQTFGVPTGTTVPFAPPDPTPSAPNSVSAPLLAAGGGQIYIDGSNRFECSNMATIQSIGYPNTPVYINSSANTATLISGVSTVEMCTYDVFFQNAHDSKVDNIVAIGAAFANIYDESGDGNSWIHPQTYNKQASNEPYGYDLEAYTGIFIDDRAHLLLNAYVGQSNNFGIYVHHDSTPANQDLLVLGGDIIGPGTGMGTFVAVGMDSGAFLNLSEFNFQTSQMCSGLYPSGSSLAASSSFRDNTNCSPLFTWGTSNVDSLSVAGALTVTGSSSLSGLVVSGPTTINGTSTVFSGLSTAGSGTNHHLCVTSGGTLYQC